MLTRGRQCPVRPEEVGARRYDQQLGRGVVPAVVPSVDETLPTRDGRVIPSRGSAEKVAKAGLKWTWSGRRSSRFATAKVTRIDHYDNREAALEAAGLSE